MTITILLDKKLNEIMFPYKDKILDALIKGKNF